jgi:hypothetical protein
MGATLRPAMMLAVNTNALVANAVHMKVHDVHLIVTSMNFPMAVTRSMGLASY